MYKTKSGRLVKPPSHLQDYEWSSNLVVKFQVSYKGIMYDLEYPLNTTVQDLINDLEYFYDVTPNKLLYNNVNLTVFRVEKDNWILNDLRHFRVKNGSIIFGL